MRRPRAARRNVDQSAFAGFRFPPEVIAVAVLAGLLRPGNAGANTAADHVRFSTRR